MPELQAKAERVSKECRAEEVLAIIVVDTQAIRFEKRKEPKLRTEKDLAALRCVAMEYRDLADFRYMEKMLLGIVEGSENSQ